MAEITTIEDLKNANEEFKAQMNAFLNQVEEATFTTAGMSTQELDAKVKFFTYYQDMLSVKRKLLQNFEAILAVEKHAPLQENLEELRTLSSEFQEKFEDAYSTVLPKSGTNIN